MAGKIVMMVSGYGYTGMTKSWITDRVRNDGIASGAEPEKMDKFRD
jgi:hypothetical protein